MVLQDRVSGGQAQAGQLQQALQSLARRSLPQFLIGWVLWGVRSSWRFGYRVSFLLPSRPKSVISQHFSFSLPQHPACSGTFQVWKVLCGQTFVAVTSASLAPSNFPLRAGYLWKWTTFLFLTNSGWRQSIQSAKTRLGADCGSDHELLLAKYRLKLKKVEKTTRPFRYDLHQIPYDYTVEVRNRFKGLDLIECLMIYGWRFVTLYRRQESRPCPR